MVNNYLKLLTYLLLSFFIFPVPPTYSAIPMYLNYQGYLEDSNGTPVTDAEWVDFSLFASEDGADLLWNEQQSIDVVDGIFNVQLGVNKPLPSDAFASPDLYLEVTIHIVGEEWEVLHPRQRITSTAFAMRAAVADSVPGGAIGVEALADQAVSTEKIADDAITSSKIVDGTIVAADIEGGSGSGLDSDTVDGLDSTAFATTGNLASIQAAIDSLSDRITTLESENQELKIKLAFVSVNTDKVINGLIGPHMIIEGANLHIRSGSGFTDGNGSVNGLGNLVVGYNESSADDPDNRGGSHNFIVGAGHNYSSYGGVVAGFSNTISGRYSAVSGGSDNYSIGDISSISGGQYNKASGAYSFVGGGGGPVGQTGNEAFSDYSAILGGVSNIAGDNSDPDNHTVGQYATVSGGGHNTASGEKASVSGGRANIAKGEGSSVSGGYSNTASGLSASVSGGSTNTASNVYASVTSGMDNEASGGASSISGGIDNNASGAVSSISGGRQNESRGYVSSITGGGGPSANNGNIAFANYSSILGGKNNVTGDCEFDGGIEANICPDNNDHLIGQQSTISGGYSNLAIGLAASVTGGHINTASGSESSVCGGFHNEAFGDSSTVNGGLENDANGRYSSVIAGEFNKAEGVNSTVVGGRGNEAIGQAATVVGGGGPNSNDGNVAFADYSAILGGTSNLTGNPESGGGTTTGTSSTISGGYGNQTTGWYSSISGGQDNAATSTSASVSGGRQNQASGNYSSVLGGGSDNIAYGNTAHGDYSSVCGGDGNYAHAYSSSILGGRRNTTGDTQSGEDVGIASTVSGGKDNIASANAASVSGGSGIVADTEAELCPGTLCY